MKLKYREHLRFEADRLKLNKWTERFNTAVMTMHWKADTVQYPRRFMEYLARERDKHKKYMRTRYTFK